MKKIIKNLLFYVGFIIGLAFLVLSLYFSFETKGDVATMVAGLWSALATVVLGIIALYQSSQYRKLSDKAIVDYKNIQIEIKNLTNSMTDAMTTLQRIEKSKYLPVLENSNYKMLGLSRTSCKKITEDKNNVIQYNYINVPEKDVFEDIEGIVEKYNTFGFFIKNIGEKTIRNFVCTDISIISITDGPHFIINKSCDIKPGQFVFIIIINIPNYSSLVEQNVSMSFKMNNLISDTYICHSNIIFYMGDDYPNVNVEFTYPSECL